MTPANVPAPGASVPPRRGTSDAAAAFDELADRALRVFASRATSSAGSSAEPDPEPATLLRYAAGRLEGGARASVEAFLGRSPWAYQCVVALVRSARTTGKKKKADAKAEAAPLAQAMARQLLEAAKRTREGAKLPVRDALTAAFVEAGGALAAAEGGKSASPRHRAEKKLEQRIAAALAQGDEQAALSEALGAIRGSGFPAEESA